MSTEITALAVNASQGALFAALAKAQARIRAALKDSTNPHFNSRYADLASVWEACREALTENGICVIQDPIADGNEIGCTTTLGHSSGEERRSGVLRATPRDKSPQAVGSCVTYLRRYQLAAMVGVAPDDDDGNAAQDRRPPVAGGAAKANTVKAGPLASASQVQQIHILREKIGGWGGEHSHPGHPYAAALLAYKDAMGKPVTSSKLLGADQANNLIKRMQGKVDQQSARAETMQSEIGELDSQLRDTIEREPGSDDDDTGEVVDAGALEDLRQAAIDKWGKDAKAAAPKWLREAFRVTEAQNLTKKQAATALQMLLAGA